MRIPVEAVLLRVFVGTDDRHGEQALYEAIVERAREMRMAGATVLPGPEGFGQSRHIRSELSVDAGPRQPMVVEIVDTDEQIDRFLPVLDGMMTSGLVTLEKVRAIHYRSAKGRPVEGGRLFRRA
jgi:PII-like signaling protein